MQATTPTDDTAGSARDRITGIALLVGAVICFACLDASAKWVNQTGNPLFTAAVRYLGSFLLVSVFLNPVRQPAILHTRSLWLQCVRALCLLASTVLSFFALHFLPMTEATAITFTSPMIVALIAGPLLGEWLGWRRGFGVIAGFAGILVVTRPFGGAFQPAVLLALGVAVTNAFYSITTRLLAGRDRSRTTLFYTGMVGSAVFLPALPFIWTQPGSALLWGLLAATGAFGAVGHWLLILAHQRAPASVLAPFFYVQLLCAAVLGALVFGETPDRFTLLGGGIVIGSGIYLLYCERRRR